MTHTISRRTFLAASGGAAVAVGLPPAIARGATTPRIAWPPPGNGTPHITWTIFSRHLQWLTTQAYCESDPYDTGVLIGNEVIKLGFAAVDLTVRSGGHVEPSMVQTNLQPMLQGIRSTGATCDQITAGLTDLTTEYGPTILNVAAENGIKRYRFGNYKYSTTSPPPFGAALLQELDGWVQPLKELEAVNEQLGLLGMYYTFSGSNVGASIWDMVYVFGEHGFNPLYMGLDYASAHVVASAATGNWVQGLELAMPWVRGISLGDSLLVQTPGSATDVGAFPGTGIVNWETFFTLLLQGGFSGPLSELFEYELNGVSLNNTWWSDTFPSTQITTAQLETSIEAALAYFKTAASAAGWSASQQA